MKVLVVGAGIIGSIFGWRPRGNQNRLQRSHANGKRTRRGHADHEKFPNRHGRLCKERLLNQNSVRAHEGV